MKEEEDDKERYHSDRRFRLEETEDREGVEGMSWSVVRGSKVGNPTQGKKSKGTVVILDAGLMKFGFDNRELGKGTEMLDRLWSNS